MEQQLYVITWRWSVTGKFGTANVWAPTPRKAVEIFREGAARFRGRIEVRGIADADSTRYWRMVAGGRA